MVTVGRDDQSSQYTKDLEKTASEIHHLLRVPRRRYVIDALRNEERNVVLETRVVARAIAEQERDGKESVGNKAYRTVYTNLTKHLEVLATHEIIEYDRDRQKLSRGPRFHVIELLRALTMTVILSQDTI